jgi:hypothetical protein
MNFIRYNTEYGFLLCQLCQIGVPPDNLLGHFVNQHRQYLRVTRKKLIPVADQINQIYNATNPADMQLPAVLSQTIPGLPVLQGYKCGRCSYVCCNKRGRSVHVAKKHKGQKIEWKITDCQRIFNHGINSHYIALQTVAVSPRSIVGQQLAEVETKIE